MCLYDVLEDCNILHFTMSHKLCLYHNVVFPFSISLNTWHHYYNHFPLGLLNFYGKPLNIQAIPVYRPAAAPNVLCPMCSAIEDNETSSSASIYHGKSLLLCYLNRVSSDMQTNCILQYKYEA